MVVWRDLSAASGRELKVKLSCRPIITSSRRSTRRDAGRSAASNAVGALWTFVSIVKREAGGVSALASSVERVRLSVVILFKKRE